MPKRKDPRVTDKSATNTANLHRETQLRVETNIQGVWHDNPNEVTRIFYKMNSQNDYSPEEDMKNAGLGNSLAGNEQSRERLRTKKKRTRPAKPVQKAGTPVTKTDDEAITKANKKDLSKKGIY